MSQSISTLLIRNLDDVFGEGDPTLHRYFQPFAVLLKYPWNKHPASRHNYDQFLSREIRFRSSLGFFCLRAWLRAVI
jgi:hypothetical protein